MDGDKIELYFLETVDSSSVQWKDRLRLPVVLPVVVSGPLLIILIWSIVGLVAIVFGHLVLQRFPNKFRTRIQGFDVWLIDFHSSYQIAGTNNSSLARLCACSSKMANTLILCHLPQTQTFCWFSNRFLIGQFLGVIGWCIQQFRQQIDFGLLWIGS